MNYSPAFLDFWAAYKCKRRVAKLQAHAEWLKQGCEDNAPEVMDGLERFKATDQWREGFMPEIGRWLKYRRWEDEPAEQDEAPAADGWDVTGPPRG